MGYLHPQRGDFQDILPCSAPYQTLGTEVELPATPWVGVFYQHFAKTTQGLNLHRRHVGAGPICVLERMKGVEPSSPVWKTGVITVIRHPHFSSFSTLHIYYNRFLKENQILLLGCSVGFEPTIFGATTRCSNQLSHEHKFKAQYGIEPL